MPSLVQPPTKQTLVVLKLNQCQQSGVAEEQTAVRIFSTQQIFMVGYVRRWPFNIVCVIMTSAEISRT